MGLEETLFKPLKENKSFILSGLTYLAASTIDYYSTLYGFLQNQIVEENPLLREYIETFGVQQGLLLSKTLFSIVVLAGCKYIDSRYKAGQTKIRAEYLLYPGALITLLQGTKWLIEKYF